MMRMALVAAVRTAVFVGMLQAAASAQTPDASSTSSQSPTPPPDPAGAAAPRPQAPAPATQPAQPVTPPASDPSSITDVGVPLPPGYVIGAEDVLAVIFWQEKELSNEVIVRPDGKISLPLLNDVQAAGYTPEQLAANVAKLASKFVAEPLATVIVKQINSRKVYVLGNVGKQGPVALTGEMNVLQLIAQVGGLAEWADKDKIVIVRKEEGGERRIRFNYDDVIRGRRTEQNIMLQPGDTILVP